MKIFFVAANNPCNPSPAPGMLPISSADLNSYQKINGQSVRTADELLAAVEKAGTAPIRVEIIRNQQPVEVTVTSEP